MHPNAKSFRTAARTSLKGYWGWALLVCLVGGLLGGAQSMGGFSNIIELGRDYAPDAMQSALRVFEAGFLSGLSLWGLVTLVIGGAVELGLCAFHTRLNLGQKPEFASLFERFDIFLKALGLRLFMGLFTCLWALLFLVPGIVAAYRYSMASYLMAEYPDMGIREAVNRSKELMDGNKGRLFCLDLSFIGWWLLSALTLGILGLWVAPYTAAARAAFYLELTGKPFGLPNAEQA
ncbi:MAG TPA: DUF975 family protein [Feifaniaceae bacterium]|nr:DUF975 family protein [Feifaniaceae bacterium]